MFDELEVIPTLNPWPERLPNPMLYTVLTKAGIAGQRKMRHMVEAGLINPKSSLSFVVLDPLALPFTRPRNMIVGIVEIGPDARRLRPNAVSKAWTHWLRGIPTGQQVAEFPHLMGDEEFAHGGSFEYRKVFAAASGLPVRPDENIDYDGDVTREIVVPFVDEVADLLGAWLNMQRRDGRSHGWWNKNNKPGKMFDVDDLTSFMST